MKDYLQPREWKTRDVTIDQAKLDALAAETGLSNLALRVCLLRGLDTAEAIREHVAPRLEGLSNPFSILGMDKAVARLSQARAGDELIRIFGDYDVDGTTGTALLSWVFRELGIRFEARQPDRFKDGYGLNVKAVEEAKASGAAILITVDNGITSFDAAEKARELGIDLIVVDHHQVDAVKGVPPAFAILNPQQADCPSGLKQLCGCGLAFYLSMALRSRGREEGWFGEASAPNLKQHLDLVVMATAADMVPLTGDNHILVRHGLEILKSSRKSGVRALLEAAGIAQKDLSPSHLGFVIGPRINASGRMVSASLALELLTTTDQARAVELARELERLNDERAKVQNEIWDQVRVRVEEGIARGKFQHGIVVADPSWHEGVVGIVATRVTEMFRRPAAVLASREDFAKGSVRSYGGKDVLGALRAASRFLLGFGGHRHAAGLSVAHENIEAFATAFDEALGNAVEEKDARPTRGRASPASSTRERASPASSLLIEGEALLDELDVRALQEIERLGPFGPGNPEPVFSVRARVAAHRILKERHLKIDLVNEGSAAALTSARAVEAIWFGGAEREDMMSEGSPIELLMNEETWWAAVPELNRFRGTARPTLRVRDWRKEPPTS